MGFREAGNDDWPNLVTKIKAAHIVLFCTPLWWGRRSSLMQRVIERLDALDEEYSATGRSAIKGKVAGIVITGSEDGALSVMVSIMMVLTWLQADHQAFVDAQRLFYNGRYEAAAALTLVLRQPDSEDLANDELRMSALIFQLKALLETPARADGNNSIGQDAALKACGACPQLMTAFFEDIRHGQTLSRAMIRSDPDDETARFFLGKLDLNYVWLQLGPLGRRTGWDQYWEGRRSLDAVLAAHPRHVRALVAPAWIDYIVDTRMPWGTRWVLGGGNRKRALVAMHSAVEMDAEFFAHAEAAFALWEMELREHDVRQATEVAQRLAHDFPENPQLSLFLETAGTHVGRNQ